jgi:pimeloyl-ACP methyl ester carboxylesterase
VAPLTVADHIAGLRDLVASHAADPRPALIGSSWGAMLALAFAAAHPDLAGPLVLIGCGTFDPAARARLHEILDQRLTDSLRGRLERLSAEIADPDRRLAAKGDLILPLYSCDLIPAEPEPVECDARAHEETWADMLRLQEQGVYPAAFAAIRGPVLMLHGADDPHPGRMILESLLPCVPQIEYREWERCGHYPWQERAARDEFFAMLKAWLSSQRRFNVDCDR